MQRKPTVISLFSGGGGLDLGLAASGFSIIFETDIDLSSCETLKRNGAIASANGLQGFEHTIVRAEDVRNIDGKSILKECGFKPGEVDVLAGGPPCQAFSVFGKRKGTDDCRGLLSFDYIRILGEIAPKAFVFENVAGLLSINAGSTVEQLLGQLSNPCDGVEYVVCVNRVNARDFCVPQNRDRVIIIGVRKELATATEASLISIKKSTSDNDDGLPRLRTVGDAFRGLPELKPNSTERSAVANHHGRKHSKRIIERYSKLKPGERDSKTRINKLDNSKPSYTVVVGSDKGGGKGHVHPIEGREVTPRESARLQTFPDWWEFAGSVRDEIRQIGNAVPALLGFHIGNALRRNVFSLQEIPLKDGIQRLGQNHLFRVDR